MLINVSVYENEIGEWEFVQEFPAVPRVGDTIHAVLEDVRGVLFCGSAVVTGVAWDLPVGNTEPAEIYVDSTLTGRDGETVEAAGIATPDLVRACRTVAFWLEARAEHSNGLGSHVSRDALRLNASLLRDALAGCAVTPPSPSA